MIDCLLSLLPQLKDVAKPVLLVKFSKKVNRPSRLKSSCVGRRQIAADNVYSSNSVHVVRQPCKLKAESSGSRDKSLARVNSSSAIPVIIGLIRLSSSVIEIRFKSFISEGEKIADVVRDSKACSICARRPWDLL